KRHLEPITRRLPPVGPAGRIAETVTLPSPSRYRVVVDAYPNLSGPLRNFQLFRSITVPGKAVTKPLPSFRPTVVVDGYRFTLHDPPALRAIKPAFLRITVTR